MGWLNNNRQSQWGGENSYKPIMSSGPAQPMPIGGYIGNGYSPILPKPSSPPPSPIGGYPKPYSPPQPSYYQRTANPNAGQGEFLPQAPGGYGKGAWQGNYDRAVNPQNGYVGQQGQIGQPTNGLFSTQYQQAQLLDYLRRNVFGAQSNMGGIGGNQQAFNPWALAGNMINSGGGPTMFPGIGW